MDETPGYIPIYRKFFDHYLWAEDREFSKAEAWIDCIRMARYKKSKTKKLIGGRLIEWGYGQFPASIRFLRERWNWKSNTKVNNFLSLLESDGMISIEKRQGQNIVTLCKYKDYDLKNSNEKTAKGQGEDSERTVGRQSEDTEKTVGRQNSNKGNKGKKDKNGKGENPPSLEEVKTYFTSKGFPVPLAEKFYAYYQEPMEDRGGRVWKDQNDKTVKSWKQKALAVWMKDDNKEELKPQYLTNEL